MSAVDRSNDQNLLLGIVVIVSAASYRPLTVWSNNAWDLSSPEKVLAIGLPFLLAGLIIRTLLIRSGVASLIASLGGGGLIVVLMTWRDLPWIHPLLWLTLLALILVVLARTFGAAAHRAVGFLFVVMLGLAPAIQVVVSHWARQNPYPTVDLYDRVEVAPSGVVEDVLLLVVDGYPALSIAEDWIGHDPQDLREGLADLGYQVPDLAWSHHTFTRLSVPSVLELQPITTPGPKTGWGNFTSTYRMTRGDNFTAAAFASAGFRYTHVESAWNGGVCADVDVCLDSPWLDDAAWTVLRPTVIGDMLASHIGSFSVLGTMRTVEQLTKLDVFDDGQRDYVYAHLLLPHAPFVVDRSCEPTGTPGVTSGLEEFSSDAPDLEAIRAQLSCVDDLIVQIAGSLGSGTAVLITADHGTGLGGQGVRGSDPWTDGDIAERLGILMAYRIPDDCDGPADITNIAAMRAVIACSLRVSLPPYDQAFLLGTADPIPVDRSRLARIESLLRAGELESGF